MGLDIHIYDQNNNQIAHFRKNPDFHKWVAEKAGYDSLYFNNISVEIRNNDIVELNNLLKNKTLPKCDVQGYFFGETDNEDLVRMEIFINVALNLFENKSNSYISIISSF